MEYKYTVEFLNEHGDPTSEKQYKNITAIQHDLHLSYESVKLINAHSEGVPIQRIQDSKNRLHSLSKQYRILSIHHTIETLLQDLIEKNKNI